MCVCEFKLTSIIKLPKSGQHSDKWKSSSNASPERTNKPEFVLHHHHLHIITIQHTLLVIYLFSFSEAMVFILCALCSRNLQGTLHRIRATTLTHSFGKCEKIRSNCCAFGIFWCIRCCRCHYWFWKSVHAPKPNTHEKQIQHHPQLQDTKRERNDIIYETIPLLFSGNAFDSIHFDCACKICNVYRLLYLWGDGIEKSLANNTHTHPNTEKHFEKGHDGNTLVN